MKSNAFNVSELNNYIKKLVSMDYILRDISITGEVTNLNIHSNGNIYFSLKDNFSRIDAMISAKDVNVKLFDGASIMAKGTVTYYDRSGRIFLYVSEIELDGKGNLYQKFLDLKDELEREGLFDLSHKKKIKKFPGSIGLITSTSGAAIKDVINLFRKRNRICDIYVFPSFVQGNMASENLIKGIKYFNESQNVDTIIIARGGGSFEDLFVFNDESLAREIFNSNNPIISAVGHEIDYTICDFVSDLRAATPTNAAELATTSEDEIFGELLNKKNSLNNLIERKVDLEKLKLFNLYKSISIKNQVYKINSMTRELIYYENLLNNSMKKILEDNRSYLSKSKFYLTNFKLNKSRELDSFGYRLKNIELNSNRKLDRYFNNLDLQNKFLNYYFNLFIDEKVSNLNKFGKFLESYDLKNKILLEKRKLEYLNIRLGSAFDKINKIEIITHDGKKLESIKDVNIGDIISLRLKDGNIKSKIFDVKMRD